MYRKRRDRLDIIADILGVAEKALKTQIMHEANLSYSQLEKYIGFLLDVNLLKNNSDDEKITYEVTPKGRKFQKLYRDLISLLQSDNPGPPLYPNKKY